jgi:hypothetical protein
MQYFFVNAQYNLMLSKKLVSAQYKNCCLVIIIFAQ